MQKINKPLVVEEFGLPRDNFSFSLQSSVNYRNEYYKAVLQCLIKSRKENLSVAGINFWSFGGFGKPVKNKDHFWKEGDDLTGDPPMEEQGLNSVFATDTSTWKLINKYVQQLRK
jgi:mannan endo-1,4-beta-mannosidase